MITAHLYTESERKQIREMVHTGKIHRSYLEYMEQPSPTATRSVPQSPCITRSTATPVFIVILLSLSIVATSRFSQTAQANTIEQLATTDSAAVISPKTSDTKLVKLISAVVKQLKDQEYRIAALETQPSNKSGIDSMQSATTRVVAKKAYIRSGPSKTSTPLMAISPGTRLVQIDDSGEWVQVYAPTGELGWINQDLLELTEPS